MTTKEKRDESVRYQTGLRIVRYAYILIFAGLAKGKIKPPAERNGRSLLYCASDYSLVAENHHLQCCAELVRLGGGTPPLQYISVLSSKYPGRLSAHWPLQLIQHLIHPWPTPAVSSCGAGRSRSRTPPTQYVKGNSLGLLHPIAAGGPGLGHDLRRPGLGRHQLLNTGTAAHGWADWSVSLVLYLLCSSWPKRVLELLGLGLSRTF